MTLGRASTDSLEPSGVGGLPLATFTCSRPASEDDRIPIYILENQWKVFYEVEILDRFAFINDQGFEC